MAEAINYTLGPWAELNVFCSDGTAPIDNNVSERAMNRVVLNRKNSLFVGNPCGSRHGVDPQLYLTELPVNRPTWPVRDLDVWLPDQWELRHAAASPTLIN